MLGDGLPSFFFSQDLHYLYDEDIDNLQYIRGFDDDDHYRTRYLLDNAMMMQKAGHSTKALGAARRRRSSLLRGQVKWYLLHRQPMQPSIANWSTNPRGTTASCIPHDELCQPLKGVAETQKYKFSVRTPLMLT